MMTEKLKKQLTALPCAVGVGLAMVCGMVLVPGKAVAVEPAAAVATNSLVREFAINKQYLLFPIKNGTKPSRMTLEVDGKAVHVFDIFLAGDKADWWAFLDVSEYKGKKASLKLKVPVEGSLGMAAVELSDTLRNLEPLYDEALRPQLRFSQMRGWNNDANGMVYYKGEYHLSWQMNPFGLPWANMYWGHAVSKDLVHWKELTPTLRPWVMAKDKCFSGSANVDETNSGGFQKGRNKTLIAVFTDTGCGEALAYSTDCGRTYTYYEGNPVIKHSGRDPMLVRYTPEKGEGWWVIGVYDESAGRNAAFYTSTDLKKWTLQSRLPNYYECPNFFKLPVLGRNGKPTGKYKWAIYGGDVQYAIGEFDGKTFTPEHEGKKQVFGGGYYAAQYFTGLPKGRVVSVGWARIEMPGMPFNQAFSLPTELTLRETEDGIRMFAEPVKELDKLRAKKHEVKGSSLADGKPVKLPVTGQLFDIQCVFKPGTAKSVVLKFGSSQVVYDVAGAKLNGMPMPVEDGKVTIRVVVDRPMFEICGNSGRVYQVRGRNDGGKDIPEISLTAQGGEATLESLTVYEMKSIWKK